MNQGGRRGPPSFFEAFFNDGPFGSLFSSQFGGDDPWGPSQVGHRACWPPVPRCRRRPPVAPALAAAFGEPVPTCLPPLLPAVPELHHQGHPSRRTRRRRRARQRRQRRHAFAPVSRYCSGGPFASPRPLGRPAAHLPRMLSEAIMPTRTPRCRLTGPLIHELPDSPEHSQHHHRQHHPHQHQHSHLPVDSSRPDSVEEPEGD